MFFQTFKTVVYLQNTNEDILIKSEIFSSLTVYANTVLTLQNIRFSSLVQIFLKRLDIKRYMMNI